MTAHKSFTLVELLVVLGVMAVLLTLGGINLLGTQRKSALVAQTSTLSADLKQQQLRAMTGDTGGAVYTGAFGVYFEGDRYVLFHGTTYNPTDPANFTVDLTDSVRFSAIGFPGATLAFATGSGEVVGFVSGADSVTLEEINNLETKSVTLNQLGVMIVE